jgi:FkbM family methyltransferase
LRLDIRNGDFKLDQVAKAANAVIYDIGMHDGSDTDYYLAKGYRVVAVEANPLLCAEAEEKFASAVAEGRLRILNVAVAETAGSATFYVKRERAPQSSLRRPADITGWKEITVTTMPLADIIERNTEIAFVKIDVERMDVVALDSLTKEGIRPKLISAEAHSFEVLLKLYSMGYTHFRLVPGSSGRRHYGTQQIKRKDGTPITYTFLPGSCGPFGEDLREPWTNISRAAYIWFGRATLLGNEAYDFHATRLED